MKHDLFLDEELAKQTDGARLLFIGLFTLADRRGRLEDRPARIKAQLFPYEDRDVEALIASLAGGRFLIRYEAEGRKYLQIRTFEKHQAPNRREPESKIPPPSTGSHVSARESTLGMDVGNGCGEGMREEDSVKDSLKPEDYPLPASLDVPAFKEAWAKWHAYRRKRKWAPWVDDTINAKLAEFEEMGLARAVAAIRYSIGQGYQGVFEQKGDTRRADTRQQAPPPEKAEHYRSKEIHE